MKVYLVSSEAALLVLHSTLQDVKFNLGNKLNVNRLEELKKMTRVIAKL